jgi:subtilisin-like proprotein convertase family protein
LELQGLELIAKQEGPTVNRRHSRVAILGAVALAMSVTVGLSMGAAEAKKKGGNKARTFQNGQQLLIPDDPQGASFPGQLDATIKVGKAMKGKEVADADVSVRITHPDTSDLDIFLIAPNGGTVGLANDNGGQAGNTSYGSGSADCKGAATTFSDETFNFLSNAALVNEPGEVLSPWAATVEPQGLPAPLNIVDGSKARGTWTLRILDDTNGDVGTLNCWKVRIKPRSP